MWDDACRWVRSRLPLLAGGELIGNDRRRLERHLIGCDGCRERLDSLRASLGVLQALGSGALPSADAPSLWPALARQIRETRRPQPSIWASPGSRPVLWAGAALAASLLVIVGAAGSWSVSRHQHARAVKAVAAPAPRPHPVAVAAPPAAPAVKEIPAVADSSNAPRPEPENIAHAAPAPPPRPSNSAQGTPAVRPASEPTR